MIDVSKLTDADIGRSVTFIDNDGFAKLGRLASKSPCFNPVRNEHGAFITFDDGRELPCSQDRITFTDEYIQSNLIGAGNHSIDLKPTASQTFNTEKAGDVDRVMKGQADDMSPQGPPLSKMVRRERVYETLQGRIGVKAEFPVDIDTTKEEIDLLIEEKMSRALADAIKNLAKEEKELEERKSAEATKPKTIRTYRIAYRLPPDAFFQMEGEVDWDKIREMADEIANSMIVSIGEITEIKFFQSSPKETP